MTYEESETAQAVKMATALNKLADEYVAEQATTYRDAGKRAIEVLREAAQLPIASLTRLARILQED